MNSLRISPVLFCLAGLSQAAAGQSIDLSSIRECGSCRIQVRPILQLGERDGSGAIESDAVELAFAPGPKLYAVYQKGGHTIQLFDETGQFVRRLGRKGEGPGELSELLDVTLTSSGILALDYRGGRLVQFDLGGRHLATIRLPVRPGPIRLYGDTAVIVASLESSGLCKSSIGPPQRSLEQ